MGLRDFFSGLKTRQNDDEKNAPVAAAPAESTQAAKLTPLAEACREGDFETAMALLKGGADPNEASYDGRTPLFHCNEVALVSLLVHFGADVNARDKDGNTPLMEILGGENVKSNGERAVIVLIESGADVEAKNSDGLSARDIAASRKASLSEFDQYMLDQGFDVETDSHDEMHAALEQGLRVIGNRRRAFEAKASQQRARRESWRAEMNPIVDNSPRNVVTNCFLACNMNDIDVGWSYDEDVKKVYETLTEVCERVKKIDNVEDSMFKGTQSFDDSVINYRVRFFCKPINRPDTKRAVMREIQKGLDEAGIKIPYKQLDVHTD